MEGKERKGKEREEKRRVGEPSRVEPVVVDRWMGGWSVG